MILPPVPKRQWQQPSQRRTLYGIENVTRHRLTARLNDGYIVWRGWFESRDDADAFLYALACGSLHHERPLWDLPVPAWRPDMGEVLVYDFAIVTFLTSPTGSNQTFNIPADWSTTNTVEAIGGGAAGRNTINFSDGRAGGAGGDYAKSVNLTLTPGGTLTYRIGAAGTVSVNNPSNSGGDTWFNGTIFPTTGQAVGARGGAGDDDVGAAAGNTANDYATGTGNAKFAGGGSGQANGGSPSANGGSGGGGAGGPSGAGSTSAASGVSGSTGGAADNSTVAGGTAANPGNIGNSGTEFDASHGCGSGGGGANGNSAGGAGGLYGGGGGGAGANGTSSSNNGGAGAQGIIVVTYTDLTILMGAGVQ